MNEWDEEMIEASELNMSEVTVMKWLKLEYYLIYTGERKNRWLNINNEIMKWLKLEYLLDLYWWKEE